MKTTGKKGPGFLAGLFKKISRLKPLGRAAVLGGTALVICGATVGICLLIPGTQASTNTGAPVSDVSSVVTSSEPISSEMSSEETSSEEASSETSSETPSSKQTSSEAKTTSSQAPVSSKATASSEPAQPVVPQNVQSNFTDILKSNSDVKGQLVLSGTKLNYYVVQGKDNYYYLDHNVYKAKFGYGVPYIDYRATLTENSRSTNLTIYGHSKDSTGEYLSAVKNYKDLNFYKQHPTITFNTIYANETYKVIALFLENVDMPNSFAYHDFVDASSDQAVLDFASEAMGRSFVSMPVDVQASDKFITISTCLSTTSKHSRYVMVARRVRDGEDASVDTSKAVMNPNMIPASGPLN